MISLQNFFREFYSLISVYSGSHSLKDDWPGELPTCMCIWAATHQGSSYGISCIRLFDNQMNPLFNCISPFHTFGVYASGRWLIKGIGYSKGVALRNNISQLVIKKGVVTYVIGE